MSYNDTGRRTKRRWKEEEAAQWAIARVQQLWNEWEIQCLVIVSFLLQAFLLFATGFRKRHRSRVLRGLLWLAYLSADSVAVFVLGRLTLQTGDPRHQLTIFWAPFLLLHLGGQETISAFSMEDSALWKRHVLNLLTQSTLAIYVVAKQWRGDRRLLPPMLLIFVCGIGKYAERAWYLRRAGSRAPGSRSIAGHVTGARREFEREVFWYYDKLNCIFVENLQLHFELVLELATRGFQLSLDFLMDVIPAKSLRPETDWNEGLVARIKSSEKRADLVYKLAEVHLSLIYDYLYTKFGGFSGMAFLLFATGFRKRHRSRVLRGLLWLAYLSADSVAVFVLGRLTLQTGDPRHQLTIFWAPFLLLHLGGQETISAFSMEDSALWKRHVLNLLTQSTLAIYVVAKQWRGDRRLLPPMLLIFVCGIGKYAERAWYLRRAGSRAPGSRSIAGHVTGARREFEREVFWYYDKLNCIFVENLQLHFELVLELATRGFQLSLDFLMDVIPAKSLRPETDWNEGLVARIKSSEKRADLVYKLAEVHLSLIYDYLYTKFGGFSGMVLLHCVLLLLRPAMFVLTSIAVSLFVVAQCNVMLGSDGHYVVKVARRDVKLFLGMVVSRREFVQKVRDGDPNVNLKEFPALDRAHRVSSKLFKMNAHDRWRLISLVCVEMICYVAQNCVAGFHAKHLSTGGEFITHVKMLLFIIGLPLRRHTKEQLFPSEEIEERKFLRRSHPWRRG
ncbi:hypothetical protein OsJ_13854 [Oryza sativa Japonica Group]|uniref:DUF4220 domain-containing protein n=2 Tax=Oryza sativa subsp. japonica TaxID=39947 RepID=B9FDT8_ORYSJ|nr:hypothetical protein OsJ_13854 [Oryza sativa Japonica Group]